MFIFGMFKRKPEPRIVDAKELEDGDIRIGDLVEVTGSCPRCLGDECRLVGGHQSVVCEYRGELYYKIVS